MAADNTVTTTMGRMGMDRAIDGGYAEYPSVFEPAGQVRVEVDEVVVGVGGTRCDAGDGADGVGGRVFWGVCAGAGKYFDKGLELVGIVTLGDSLRYVRKGGTVCMAGL